MEEDIEELEKLIKLRKEKCKGKIEFDTCIVGTKAIEHLIARNKELKDKCIELSTTIDALKTDNKELEENYINPSKARFTYFDNGKGTKVVIEGFIPKSKVEELRGIDNIDLLQFKIKQLLQEGDK